MSSEDCYSTDEGKRKKNAGEIADIFNKSKKVLRTPDRSSSKTDDKLDRILGAIQTLSEQVKELTNEQAEFKQEIRKMKTENEIIKRENAEFKQEIRLINDKLDALEREKRRNNVVIQGIKLESTDHNTIKEEMIKFMEKELGIDAEIKTAKKIGKETCLVEFNSIIGKDKVMKNKSKLRLRIGERVYINDDMTKTEREIQGKIRKQAKEEKERGNNVKIGFMKLIVNNEVWKWDKYKSSLQKESSKQKN